jgi:hypothetical protein
LETNSCLEAACVSQRFKLTTLALMRDVVVSPLALGITRLKQSYYPHATTIQ